MDTTLLNFPIELIEWGHDTTACNCSKIVQLYRVKSGSEKAIEHLLTICQMLMKSTVTGRREPEFGTGIISANPDLGVKTVGNALPPEPSLPVVPISSPGSFQFL